MKCTAMDNLPHRFCQSGYTDRHLRQAYEFHPSDRPNILNTCWHFPGNNAIVSLHPGFEPGDSWEFECPKGVANIRFQGLRLGQGSEILTPKPATVRITYEESSVVIFERVRDLDFPVKTMFFGENIAIFIWHESARQWCYHIDADCTNRPIEYESAYFESEGMTISAALKSIIGFAEQKKKALDDQECTESAT